jgi:hypothetical protein
MGLSHPIQALCEHLTGAAGIGAVELANGDLEVDRVICPGQVHQGTVVSTLKPSGGLMA